VVNAAQPVGLQRKSSLVVEKSCGEGGPKYRNQEVYMQVQKICFVLFCSGKNSGGGCEKTRLPSWGVVVVSAHALAC
jgi:hypothetical protein